MAIWCNTIFINFTLADRLYEDPWGWSKAFWAQGFSPIPFERISLPCFVHFHVGTNPAVFVSNPWKVDKTSLQSNLTSPYSQLLGEVVGQSVDPKRKVYSGFLRRSTQKMRMDLQTFMMPRVWNRFPQLQGLDRPMKMHFSPCFVHTLGLKLLRYTSPCHQESLKNSGQYWGRLWTCLKSNSAWAVEQKKSDSVEV